MGLLVAGVLLWMAVHLPKAAAPGLRAGLVARLGERPWRSLASLLLVGAVVLMVLGYGRATPVLAYRPPDWGHDAGVVVALVGMILFAASAMKTNIKRYLRHPQLLSVVLWSVGHLLAGGSWPGLVLFGGLGIWAMIEMRAISLRDGPWERPGPVPAWRDTLVLVTGLVAAAVAIGVHHWRGVAVLTV